MNSLTKDPITLAYHELRAPLGLVVTAARDAAELSGDADVRSRCESIVRAAERMLRTANQVFVLAHAGDEPSEAQSFLVAEAVTRLVGDFRCLGRNVGATSLCTGHDHLVSGSREGFEALLQSLVVNALDHGREGGAIAVAVGCREGSVSVSVRNEVGRARHQGLGAGLYLCRQIAGANGWGFTAGASGELFEAVVEPGLAVVEPVGLQPGPDAVN